MLPAGITAIIWLLYLKLQRVKDKSIFTPACPSVQLPIESTHHFTIEQEQKQKSQITRHTPTKCISALSGKRRCFTCYVLSRVSLMPEEEMKPARLEALGRKNKTKKKTWGSWILERVVRKRGSFPTQEVFSTPGRGGCEQGLEGVNNAWHSPQQVQIVFAEFNHGEYCI